MTVGSREQGAGLSREQEGAGSREQRVGSKREQCFTCPLYSASRASATCGKCLMFSTGSVLPAMCSARAMHFSSYTHPSRKPGNIIPGVYICKIGVF